MSKEFILSMGEEMLLCGDTMRVKIIDSFKKIYLSYPRINYDNNTWIMEYDWYDYIIIYE